jgi:hypothetical protein
MNVWEVTEDDLRAAAAELEVEPRALDAVARVESAGSGFLEPGVPTILFEGHVFWRELKKAGIAPEAFAAAHPSIVYPKWDKARYLGGKKEYDRLREAEGIHRTAALRSASWGAFQIMGFNYAACGFADVEAFVEAHKSSAAGQLRALGAFLRSQRLAGFLRDKNWAEFARRYNGPGYLQNRYDEKLHAAYVRSGL